ncbi:unnamed protein product [Caenorhabditis angaria]|uniref:DM2 domain-containing protein n=1 Tax=Caenorhabditis angaria TaxID=860376 RepID=A0A9P1IJS1_9PELO|nr:unnamed protein product [Caenorhabditis angaria]
MPKETPCFNRKLRSRVVNAKHLTTLRLEKAYFKKKPVEISKTTAKQKSPLVIVQKPYKCFSKKRVWKERLVYCPADLQKITNESILIGKEARRRVTHYIKHNKLYNTTDKIVTCDKRLEKALGVKEFHLLQTNLHVMNAVKMRHEFGKEHEKEQKEALIRMIMDFKVKQEVCDRIKIKQEVPPTSDEEEEEEKLVPLIPNIKQEPL